ncbi:MAG: hypothetical protein IPN95_21650 [Bacteroidetes bacterium]|nr:hypothetical protein [Bacteroidota bacterium]
MENPVQNFPEIKREALHLLIELQDEALLSEVHRIFSTQADWWDDLTPEEQAGSTRPTDNLTRASPIPTRK